MIWTILDYCRNCGHRVHTHIGPYGRDGEQLGYFKVSVWDKCNWRLSFRHNACDCTKFLPKDNLKYLENEYESKQ